MNIHAVVANVLALKVHNRYAESLNIFNLGVARRLIQSVLKIFDFRCYPSRLYLLPHNLLLNDDGLRKEPPRSLLPEVHFSPKYDAGWLATVG